MNQTGTFVKELFLAPQMFGNGSVWDIEISSDLEQRFMQLADGENYAV